ncbi:MAG TPA: signal peptide peptidase SppA [Nitrospirota bacterium]|nr:signal peptide peptidase SppA [Nitrospirota bacterium]
MKKILFAALASILLPALSGCAFIRVSLMPEVQPLEEHVLSGEGKDKIVLMDITGVITSEESSSAIGGIKKPGMLAEMREGFDRARKDRNVKAVVLRINSPGGGVTASDTLYHEIKKFKMETGVKVIAHFLDAGTSGAYYAALASDRITAQPTSITGSIGVILLRIDATGLMQKIGVQTLEISSGEHKGMGSPFRPVSAEEKKIFQTMIDNLYGRFVGVVADERKMAPERVRQLADGRVYTSQEAKDAGLIDDIGYLDDAFVQARKLANLERATVVTYLRPGEYRPNIYSMNMININLGDLAGPGVRLAYLWWP